MEPQSLCDRPCSWNASSLVGWDKAQWWREHLQGVAEQRAGIHEAVRGFHPQHAGGPWSLICSPGGVAVWGLGEALCLWEDTAVQICLDESDTRSEKAFGIC